MENKINQLAAQLLKDGFWDSFNEESYISVKNTNSQETFVRVFRECSGIYGLGVYTTAEYYALSQEILADKEEGCIIPISFLQNAFVGSWDIELGNEIDPDQDIFSFDEFRNGYILEVEDKKTTALLLDVMESLVKAFERYDLQLYRKGMTINKTSNGAILLLEPEMNFFEFHSKIGITFRQNDSLAELQAMNSTKRQIFVDTFLSPFEVPIQNGSHFPCAFYAVDIADGELLQTLEIEKDDNLAFKCADLILNLSRQFGKPSAIICRHPVFYTLIKDFCDKINVALTFQQNMPECITQDTLMSLAQEIMPFFSQFFDLMDSSDTEPASSETVYSDKPLTYKISVSVDKGCYRHIKISANATLEELHNAIQQAFDFDNDHAYAFFTDNHAWSDNAYYCDGIDNRYPLTQEHTLYEVLKEKKPFLYLFDFGDEWRFQCKLLSVTEEECPEAVLWKSVGKAPEQYPDYDEEDF